MRDLLRPVPLPAAIASVLALVATLLLSVGGAAPASAQVGAMEQGPSAHTIAAPPAPPPGPFPAAPAPGTPATVAPPAPPAPPPGPAPGSSTPSPPGTPSAPQPAPAQEGAPQGQQSAGPVQATPASAPSGYGCAAAVSYLEAHAAPGFQIECPSSAEGHEAMTCMNVSGVCPGTSVIAIDDPCPAAYMNEASNSWVISGQSDAPIDPFGAC